jgi:lysophospholipase L1-like esterase
LLVVALLAVTIGCAGGGATGATRIMPLGDSITDGYQMPGGYRVALWRLLTENGFDVDFVGSLQNGPSSLPDRDHEGHTGWRIDQIQAFVPSPLRTYRPDVVLLLIGTNDVLRNYRVADAPRRLDLLLDTIHRLRPATTILVSTIPPSADSGANAAIVSYDEALRKVVRRRAHAGWPIWLVDAAKRLTRDDLADGVHPDGDGYAKLARAWYAVLKRVLQPSD